MKSMTCNQLGGACEKVFSAQTFQEIAQLSQAHGQDMLQKGDAAHIHAMQNMRKKMADPKVLKEWMAEKEALFNSLPKD